MTETSTTIYTALRSRLDAGDLVVIDGAVGTEVERRGAAMTERVWSGAAAMTAPDVLRQVHEDNIAAGAEVIIANTFGTSRHLLAWGGFEDHFEELNRRSLELALEARERTGAAGVAVAASISSSRQGGPWAEIDVARRNFADQAQILAEGGPDFFVLEMMRDIDQTVACLDAVAATGLPVWLGWSCFADPARPEPVLYDEQVTLAEGIEAVAGYPIDAMAVMHTEVGEVDRCLDVVDASSWTGPVGVYAHSGVFEHPNWIFDDIISEAEHLDAVRGWVARGVRIVGGCCGITPGHIHRITEARPDLASG